MRKKYSFFGKIEVFTKNKKFINIKYINAITKIIAINPITKNIGFFIILELLILFVTFLNAFIILHLLFLLNYLQILHRCSIFLILFFSKFHAKNTLQELLNN